MANTSILAAFERMWTHVVNALGSKTDNSGWNTDVYLGTDSGGTVVEKNSVDIGNEIVNLHVWEEWDGNLGTMVTEEEDVLILASYAAAGTTTSVVSYADSVSIVNDEIVLNNPSSNISISYTQAAATSANNFIGKYIKVSKTNKAANTIISNTIKFYYIPDNATVTYDTDGAGGFMFTQGVVVSNAREVHMASMIGYTTSTEEDTYPYEGEYNGHWYIKRNIIEIEEYMTESNPVGTGSFSMNRKANTDIGDYSFTEGYDATASGTYSHAAGFNTTSLNSQYVIGHYNGSGTAGSTTGTTGDAFIIGKGTSSSGSNAFRVNYAGKAFAVTGAISSGADYAEYFEWKDSNPNNEDRRGYFVTLDGENIKIAEPNDYILGVISGMPCVIGNGDECWRGRYIQDEFGAFITEEFEYEEEVRIKVVNEETGEVTYETKTVTKIGTRYKENPDYDPTLSYIQREDRPEWDAVGMVGVLSVRDDGTCKVNGFCKVAEGGIATASENGYRVISRVNENIVRVVFK